MPVTETTAFHHDITCPCIVYPLIPNFNIVKVGYTGGIVFFLQNIDCGYSLNHLCVADIFQLKIIKFYGLQLLKFSVYCMSMFS